MITIETLRTGPYPFLLPELPGDILFTIYDEARDKLGSASRLDTMIRIHPRYDLKAMYCHGIRIINGEEYVEVERDYYNGVLPFLVHILDILPILNTEYMPPTKLPVKATKTKTPTGLILDKSPAEDKLEFDKERLAREIDEHFQKVSDATIADTSEKMVLIFDEFISKAKEGAEAAGEAADKLIKETIRINKEIIVEEIAKGRTVIHIASAMEPIHIDHMDHPEMESVVKSLAMYRKAMLVGPAGTGKTTIVQQIATKMGLPFYKYSCSRDSSVHDLLGYKQPRSETYLNTTFLQAYEHGGMFLVDEYDAMSGDMALFFNGVTDNSSFISVPHRDTNPVAEKHKDFYIIMCGNTWGKGSYEYTGRDFQDKALLDRFRFCRHFIGYHHKLEKHLMGKDLPFAVNLRKELEAVGSYLSTRNIEDISRCLANRVSKKDIFVMSIQDLPEADKTHMHTKEKNIV